MKLDPKSYISLTSVLGILFLVGLIGCKSKSELPTGSQEVSLQADRSSLEEFRKEIPEEKKKENDELALILQIMNAKDKKPYEIREKFNTVMRKKREEFNKIQKRTREQFTRMEREERDKFTREQKEQSDKFYRSKPTSDERKYFSQDHSTRREKFYTDSRERRQAFEDDMRSKDKDFAALVSEKNKEFEEHYKAYEKEYKEKKNLEEVKKAGAKENASDEKFQKLETKDK